MSKVLIADNSERDADRLSTLLRQLGITAEICTSGAEAEGLIEAGAGGFEAVMILWEIPGPPSGFELLMQCRQRMPSTPVVVMSGTLDAALAARAYAFGARDFLEKPLDTERVRSCVESVLAAHDPLSPLVVRLRELMVGESEAFTATLKQVARAIPRADLRVLLVGESGTGKELLARAIHQLSESAARPWVAVNVGAIPPELSESALFGHEKGAFTDAADRHVGYLEEASDGTLFLDEIGELKLALQVKLLRALQEKEFRRIKGAKPLLFKARLVCATNRDLTAEVAQGRFRADLYHRIAERTIKIPPLRERDGDLDLLLKHFLRAHAGERAIRLARETMTILRSYHFPGNVRELDNIIRTGVVEADGELLLPRHLPLLQMKSFLDAERAAVRQNGEEEADSRPKPAHAALLLEVQKAMPANWLALTYREALQPYERAFDRIYLQRLLERCRHNISRAASKAGVDVKTFRKRWRDCGLPPLGGGEGHFDD
jgi:two-component system nitrogen regulation response regulator GlnG